MVISDIFKRVLDSALKDKPVIVKSPTGWRIYNINDKSAVCFTSIVNDTKEPYILMVDTLDGPLI